MPLHEEYQPTAKPLHLYPRLPRIIQVSAWLVGLIFGNMLLAIAVARHQPPVPTFAYTLPADAQDSLYLYDTRYHIAVRVLQAQQIFNVRWAPNGEGLALNDSNHESWYMFQLDGERRSLLPAEQLGTSYLSSPDWSQYLHVQDGHILLYDPAINPKQFQLLVSDLLVREVLWSPDGTRVAVNLLIPNAETREIGILDVATRTLRIITPYPALYSRLRWSSDGGMLAYVRIPGDVYSYDTRNGSTLHLVSGNRHPIASIAWNPQGNQLAYSVRDGALFLQPVPTGKPRILLETLASDSLLAWSPDDDWLMIRSGTLMQHDVMLLNVRTGERRRLPLSISSQGFISWQP